MFDVTTVASSYVNLFDIISKRSVILYIVTVDKNTVQSIENSKRRNWLNKYWGRATEKSTVQNIPSEVIKYFSIKDSIFKMMSVEKIGK